ncbi:hypothetical protein CC85DRAFT_298888 [Cutaneotrichosporon oleaginosum]|uniref:Hydrophobin n=1 Tax=Cutaneotrichosporon oleaginosum TaxID=879819 RepID=A0A0J0XYT6_9TREE|nr:uncharacterized protein CC85DRAFT_298888 [Cutaneotrichosporon oleaginosum]KLT46196.1 hypothetical protein CC85DRAFT_298888 [Cutaneotrichosporon oleaginosum]TXT10203.1 hypothetical protein COLE_04137 [Cutaneotrichosporon oleaginosum]
MLVQTIIAFFLAASATAHPVEAREPLDVTADVYANVLGLVIAQVGLDVNVGGSCGNPCGDKCLPPGAVCCTRPNGPPSGKGCPAPNPVCKCANDVLDVYVCLAVDI